MATPFLGEVKIFAGTFAIRGWALCQGQLMAINQNDALFALIGTIYGGDGQNTFGLPDLRGRVPLHVSGSHPQGQVAGTETVTLLTSEIPSHNHGSAKGSANAGVANVSPTGAYWSRDPGGQVAEYRSASNTVMNAQAIGIVGGSQPHENMQPYLTLNFQIALEGVFPSQN